jgi:predicted nucleic acid-binding protein
MRRQVGERVVLDTSVLIHLLREDATGQALEARYGLTKRPERPILPTVVEGELLAFARYQEWGQERIERLQSLLRELVRVDVGHHDIVVAYAELYCDVRRAGRYQQFRQNDLWIAATARASRAVLYTCNGKDFDWIDPAYIMVVNVEQA